MFQCLAEMGFSDTPFEYEVVNCNLCYQCDVVFEVEKQLCLPVAELESSFVCNEVKSSFVCNSRRASLRASLRALLATRRVENELILYVQSAWWWVW
jgi:hypothetical protein